MSQSPPTLSVRQRHLAVLSLYGCAGLVVMWHILSAGISQYTVYPAADPSMPIWALGYYAHAIAHLQNPFFTHLINEPTGYATMISTPLWSLAMVPVTWLVGPVVSFNILLFVLPVASAYVMFLAMRHWVSSDLVSALAGLMWGFSPFAMAANLLGWINWTTAVTLPLLLLLATDLWVLRRWSDRRLGVSLAGIAILTFFTNSEMLVVTAVVGLLVLVLMAVVWWRRGATRPQGVARRVTVIATWALIPSAILVLPAAWYATHGPNPLPSWVWPEVFMRMQGMNPSRYVSPSSFHNTIVTVLMTYPNSYFVGALVVVPVACALALTWRRPLTIVLSIVGALSLWFSLGAAVPLDIFRVFLVFPVLHNVMPRSFVPVAFFCIVALAAIGVNEARSCRPDSVAVCRWLSVTLGLLMSVQILQSAFSASPMRAEKVGSDPAAAVLASHSPTMLTLMTYPFPEVGRGLIAQAQNGFTYRVVGAMGPSANLELPDSRFFTYTTAALTLFGFIPAHEGQWLHRLGSDIYRTGAQFVIVPIRVPRHLRSYGFAGPKAMTEVMTAIWGPARIVAGERVFTVSASRLARVR